MNHYLINHRENLLGCSKDGYFFWKQLYHDNGRWTTWTERKYWTVVTDEGKAFFSMFGYNPDYYTLIPVDSDYLVEVP